VDIYEMTASEMRDRLERGELCSVEIVKALHDRADEVESHVNGFAHQFRDEALRQALRADEERSRGEARGPLHGLPLTVKENIDTQGTASTMGLRARVGRPAERDAVIVRLAREAGVIVLGKSNVPQALLPMHCTNAIFGSTRNPWSSTHVTGGSSGGEGALLASGESVLGLGTDLGGSIRFPASFCGVAGLKPTTCRWSNVGLNSPIAGQEFVRAQVGPMARTSRDVALLLRGLDSPQHSRHDLRVPPLALRDPDQIDLSKLRIGFYEDDGFISPAPACRRAVREALVALERAGAELVPMPPPNQREVVRLYIGATSGDGMRSYRRALAGEPVVDSLKMMWRLGRLPPSVRRLGARILSRLGEERLAAVVDASGEKSVARLWELVAQRNALRVAETQMWQAAGIQGLVCPASASPAVPIGMDHDFSIIFSYFGRYNLLGLPAAVAPVTRVRPDETDGPAGGDRIDRRAAAVAERSQGLPVAVQVVGPAWREDIVLAVMFAIEDHARAGELFPHTPVEPVRCA
jgi:fatty acid amide hydrolase